MSAPSRMITVRLPVDEYMRIKYRASLAKLSMNEWLRRVALGNLPNGYEAKHVETKQTEPHQAKASQSKDKHQIEHQTLPPGTDPMLVYLEVSRWKSRCAELLEALREIDAVGHRDTSQLAHDALNRFVNNTRKPCQSH